MLQLAGIAGTLKPTASQCLRIAGRPVGPGLGRDRPRGLQLDPVIADRQRRIHGAIEVVPGDLLDRRLRVGGGIGEPGAGVAVGLQFEAHLRRLRPGAVARGLGPGQHAAQVGDVVAVLVRDHVRLGRIPALSAELTLQHAVEEAVVEVDHLVCRAVERADSGGGRSAAGGGPAAEDLRLRRHVAGVRLRPECLDRVGVRDEPTIAVLRDIGAGGALRVRVGCCRGRDTGRGTAAEQARVDAEQQGNDHHQQAGPAAEGDRGSPASAAAADLGRVELRVLVVLHAPPPPGSGDAQHNQR